VASDRCNRRQRRKRSREVFLFPFCGLGRSGTSAPEVHNTNTGWRRYAAWGDDPRCGNRTAHPLLKPSGRRLQRHFTRADMRCSCTSSRFTTSWQSRMRLDKLKERKRHFRTGSDSAARVADVGSVRPTGGGTMRGAKRVSRFGSGVPVVGLMAVLAGVGHWAGGAHRNGAERCGGVSNAGSEERGGAVPVRRSLVRWIAGGSHT
jgi:hypothetical protein